MNDNKKFMDGVSSVIKVLREISEIPEEDLLKFFECETLEELIRKHGYVYYTECLDSYLEQKEKEKIHVGDIIIRNNNYYLVTGVEEDKTCIQYSVLSGDGYVYSIFADGSEEKTGESIPEITNILNKIKKEQRCIV